MIRSLLSEALRSAHRSAISFLKSGLLTMEPNQLGDRFGALEWVIGAPEEVLGRFATTRDIMLEGDDATFDRNTRDPRAHDPMAPGAGELPVIVYPPDVDRVNLAVALHRLSDRGRPGMIDGPQPIAQVDLERIEGKQFTRIYRRIRHCGHV